MKGEKLPDDPIIGVVFLVMAAVFAGVSWLVTQKSENGTSGQV